MIRFDPWIAGIFACSILASGCSRDILVGSNAGGGTSSAGDGGHAGGTTGGGGITVVGHACTDIGLESADVLGEVDGQIIGKNVRIRIEPRAGAADYRVYLLPRKSDVSGAVVRDAIYRCAGDTEVPAPAREDATTPPSPAFRTRIESAVEGYARTKEDATLGYVFVTPGPNRVPVYALGEPTRGKVGGGTNSDNVDCNFMRWPESRVKKYTTSANERDALLDAHYRDDGIAFYAAASNVPKTRTVYESAADADFHGPLYLTTGAEFDARKASGMALTPAFSVFTSTSAGARALERVYYAATCGRAHDELVAGTPRFEKALAQGSQPIPELHYSGLEGEATLVVEALDQPCPFRGVLGAAARAAGTESGIDYPAILTLDQMRAASPRGEVFVNGQGPEATPHAIARACLDVSPSSEPAATFRFDGGAEVFGPETATAFQSWNTDSRDFQAELTSVATDEWSLGTVLGELRVTWGDWAAGSSGLLRLTTKKTATMATKTFLHVTMEVDNVVTDRRLPQLLISDQMFPVQKNLTKGKTLIVQTRGGVTSPVVSEIELCDHQTWEGGTQCPGFPLYELKTGGDFLAPQPEMNGLAGVDRTVFFDVFASTEHVYLFTNGAPYGCADLPAGGFPAGPVSITFGDVLFVSGSDYEVDWYPFQKEHLPNLTTRHFSNLSFDENTASPEWNEARHPCVPASALK